MKEIVAFVFLDLCYLIQNDFFSFCSSLYLPEKSIILFFLTAEYYSISLMYHTFIVCSSADDYPGCFYFLTSVNTATMDVNELLYPLCVELFGCLFKNGIGGSCDRAISGFLTIFHTDFLHRN